jgi:glycosyltransferase 2 family protein
MQRYLPVLRAVVSLTAISLLFSVYDFKNVFRLASHLPAQALAISIGAFVANTAISIFKWKLALPQTVNLSATTRGYVASYFYSLLPTGQIGAELGKVVALAKHASLHALTSSVIFDRVTGLLALALLGITAWLFTSDTEAAWIPMLVIAVAVTCIGALALAPFFRRKTEGENRRPILIKLNAVAENIAHLAENRPLLLKALILGVAGQACMLVTYNILANAIGIELPIADFSLLVVVANLATIVPVSLGGVGVREASLVGLLAQHRIDGESALALSLTVFAVFMLGAVAGGAIELHELVEVWRNARAKANRPRRIP